MNIINSPHSRLNILTGEWILVSPQRTQRPWQGKIEESPNMSLPSYDPACYLCPGNQRASNKKNPFYEGTYVFENDFPALIAELPEEGYLNEKNLLVAQSQKGICRVICFSPRHDLTLALMETKEICKVVDCWAEQYTILGSLNFIRYIQIFENRGAIMGCSNPHPHGQIWATEQIPPIPAIEQDKQKQYFESTTRCLLCDYLDLELKKKERIVFGNSSFVVVVPFWAVWPFEVMILPLNHVENISQLNSTQRTDLADAIRRIGIRFDNLFSTFFPYSMGIHQSPSDGHLHPEWHMHLHYYPPLLRSSSVKKFMVGFEMLAMAQRDITAEASAQRLRECPEIHFLSK